MIFGVQDLPVLFKAALRGIPHTRDIHKFFIDPDRPHRHFILSQRPRLVRADHRGAAQGLHRRQPADQGVAFGHPADAQRQGDGHDRGQALGDGRHREAQGGQKDIDKPYPPD